ncbi:tryptophan-rich antigen [Plasmodium gonderi]|uniref:Tryptophan-rich antigen n=1 Tax=Plasmodium gonderi TaxID=77519 RepID=A0A1Y1JMS0_PLAGO|nr:tryptophan-rich antigen [Plasmodium gonderi]GAW83886.1 tryptophan-rich antigen [Plasmodium gonderi]
MDTIRTYLEKCRTYSLRYLSIILGVAIKMLKNSNEDARCIHENGKKGNLINEVDEIDEADEVDDSEDDDDDDDEEDEEEDDDNEDDDDEEEDDDKREADTAAAEVDRGLIAEVNNNIKDKELNNNLPKEVEQNINENESKGCDIKENANSMIKEECNDKHMNGTKGDVPLLINDNSISEDIKEKKDQNSNDLNQESKHSTHMKVEHDAKIYSMPQVDDKLKRDTDAVVVEKVETRKTSKRVTAGGKKGTTAKVTKRPTAKVAKRETTGTVKQGMSMEPKRNQKVLPKQESTILPKQESTILPKQESIILPKLEKTGQDFLETVGQTMDKINEKIMSIVKELQEDKNQNKKEKIVDFNKLKSEYKDNEDNEKGVNSNESKNDEITEEWKVNEWNKWMRQLEEQWHFFNMSLDNKASEWMKQKDGEFEKWITDMQTKWMNYNHNLDIEYNTDLYKKCYMWDETDWKTWIRTNGKKLMEEDWVKWINDNECKLNEWLNYDWTQWKSLNNFNWEMSEWKSDEYEMWEDWDNVNLTKWLNTKKRKKYLIWKTRIEKEREQWDNWVASKNELTLKNKHIKWKEWKDEKRLIFNEWVGNFINTWISKKQWNAWVLERRNVLLSKRT